MEPVWEYPASLMLTPEREEFFGASMIPFHDVLPVAVMESPLKLSVTELDPSSL